MHATARCDDAQRAAGLRDSAGRLCAGQRRAASANTGLDGTGVTVGVLCDSFNCYAVYGTAGSGVPASGLNGFAPSGFLANGRRR